MEEHRNGFNKENDDPSSTEDTYIVEQEDFEEEFATEIVDDSLTEIDLDESDDNTTNNIYGWIAIGLSVLSFIMMPYIFAGAAIILGFIARSKEKLMLGNIAIIVGIISILFRIIFFNLM